VPTRRSYWSACIRRCAAWVALPHGRRDAPDRAAGVAATHACADRRVSAAAGHRSRAALSVSRWEAWWSLRAAIRWVERVVPQPCALDRVSRRPGRVCARAMERMRAPARDAASPVGAADATARAAAREPVARAARASWSRGRLSARASSRSRPWSHIRRRWSALTCHPPRRPPCFPRAWGMALGKRLLPDCRDPLCTAPRFGVPPHGPR